MSNSYFNIQKDHLKGLTIFPFNLYVFNPVNQLHVLFLPKGTPLDEDKEELIYYIECKGGAISVDMTEKRTFLHALKITSEEIPSLQKQISHPLVIEHLEAIKKIEEGEGFDIRTAFKKMLETDDWSELQKRLQLEAEALSPFISSTVSLAKALVKKSLQEINIISKIVILSYFLAKASGLKDEFLLSDIIVSAFLHHVGMTQLDFNKFAEPYLSLSDEDSRIYKRHVGFSTHLLKKCGVEISDRCYQVIEEHHERFDGRGFPKTLKGEHIDILALIVGASSHAIEFSEKLVTGTSCKLKTTLNYIANGTIEKGLEINFGERVQDGLQYLLSLSEEL